MPIKTANVRVYNGVLNIYEHAPSARTRARGHVYFTFTTDMKPAMYDQRDCQYSRVQLKLHNLRHFPVISGINNNACVFSIAHFRFVCQSCCLNGLIKTCRTNDKKNGYDAL